MATKKPSIKKAVAKKPAVKKPIVKKAIVKKPIVSKMKNGGKVKKAQTGITTSTSYDPETKETTIKKSWSNTRSGSLRTPVKSSSTPIRKTNVSSKPAPRVISKPTVSKTPISATTRGERTMTSFPSPTPAGQTMKAEIKAGSLPDRKVTPKLTRKEIFDIKTNLETDKLKQRFPGMTIEQAKRKKQKESEEYYKKQSKSTGYQKNTGGDNSSKQVNARACKGC